MTESEWEWAARGPVAGGSTATAYYWGNTATGTTVAVYAWYGKERTRAVAELRPNGYGLFDMSGNVGELVWDRVGTYPTVPTSNYVGADDTTATDRARRGGAWTHSVQTLRSARRLSADPNVPGASTGFRLARSAP